MWKYDISPGHSDKMLLSLWDYQWFIININILLSQGGETVL